MAKKSMPGLMAFSGVTEKPALVTQPDRSSYGYLDTRQREKAYAQQDRLYAPPKTAPAVSMVPGAKNSWNK